MSDTIIADQRVENIAKEVAKSCKKLTPNEVMGVFSFILVSIIELKHFDYDHIMKIFKELCDQHRKTNWIN